jgi:hypothetical protein
MGYIWPIPEDPLPVAHRRPHPKESVWPWSPNYQPPIAASDEEGKPATPKVTRANFREVARGFDAGQLRRLAALMRRHDPGTCEECAATGRRGHPRCGFCVRGRRGRRVVRRGGGG